MLPPSGPGRRPSEGPKRPQRSSGERPIKRRAAEARERALARMAAARQCFETSMGDEVTELEEAADVFGQDTCLVTGSRFVTLREDRIVTYSCQDRMALEGFYLGEARELQLQYLTCPTCSGQATEAPGRLILADLLKLDGIWAYENRQRIGFQWEFNEMTRGEGLEEAETYVVNTGIDISAIIFARDDYNALRGVDNKMAYLLQYLPQFGFPPALVEAVRGHAERVVASYDRLVASISRRDVLDLASFDQFLREILYIELLARYREEIQKLEAGERVRLPYLEPSGQRMYEIDVRPQ